MILKKDTLVSKNTLGPKNHIEGVVLCFPETLSFSIPLIADSLAGQTFLRRQLALRHFFSVAKWRSGRSLFSNVCA